MPSSRPPDLPDVSPEERDALKLWVVLSRTYASLAAHAAADVARHGLTIAEFGVLEALHHKGRMLLGEVQRSLLVSSGGVTYLVDRLEKRGLVRRDRCDEDRRARYAVLTDAGTAFVREIFPQHAEALRRAMAALPSDEQQLATRLLRTLGRSAAALAPAGGDASPEPGSEAAD